MHEFIFDIIEKLKIFFSPCFCLFNVFFLFIEQRIYIGMVLDRIGPILFLLAISGITV